MKSPSKKRAFVIFVVIVGFFILLFIQPFRRKWIAPVPGVDLTPASPSQSPGDVQPGSAWDLIGRAGAELARIHFAARPDYDKFHDEVEFFNSEPWTDSAFPTSAQYLAMSGTALDLMRQASRATDKRVPDYGPTGHVPYMEYGMTLVSLLTASAAKKAAQADYDGAYADLDAVFDYGDVLERGPSLINTIIGIGNKSIALNHMRYIALQNAVPGEVAIKTIRYLEAAEKAGEPLEESFRMEARKMPAYADMIADGKFAIFPEQIPEWLGKRPGLIMLLTASSRRQMRDDAGATFSQMIFIVSQPYDRERLRKFDRIFEPPLEGPQLWAGTTDPPGYLWMESFSLLAREYIIEHNNTIAALRITEVELAIGQFEQNEKHPPASLGELAPKYFSMVPLDPYDGKPLRYKVRQDGTWIVYSVGANQTDDGGLKSGSTFDYDAPGDIVFSSAEATEQLKKIEEWRKKAHHR